MKFGTERNLSKSGPKLLLLGLFAFLLLFSVPSAADIKVPEPQGYVTDLAGVIEPTYEKQMENLSRTLKQKADGAEIAVLVVESTEPEPVFDYGMAVAEAWKPGDKEKENGVLILVSTEQRRVRIFTGYGVEGVLPDGKAGAIIDQYIKPSLSKGNYGQGLLTGMVVIASVIDPQNAGVYKNAIERQVSPRDARPGKRRQISVYDVIIMIPVIIVFIYLLIRHPRLLLLLVLFGFGRGGGGGFGGGFSGGFGGFGGGGFGGGGAGRGF